MCSYFSFLGRPWVWAFTTRLLIGGLQYAYGEKGLNGLRGFCPRKKQLVFKQTDRLDRQIIPIPFWTEINTQQIYESQGHFCSRYYEVVHTKDRRTGDGCFLLHLFLAVQIEGQLLLLLLLLLLAFHCWLGWSVWTFFLCAWAKSVHSSMHTTCYQVLHRESIGCCVHEGININGKVFSSTTISCFFVRKLCKEWKYNSWVLFWLAA